MMKPNIGRIDCALRLIVAGTIAVLYLAKVINGTLAVILGIVAAILILTSLAGICPLYMPFGISTRKKNKPAA
jgi:ABC-type uncharacterized transport system permease subunit